MAPNHPDALHLMGMIAYQLGMHDVSETFFSNALESAPNFADGHNNLGVVLMEQGKLAEAAASYQKAISLQPTNANAHYNLGNVLKEQGNLTEAVASYRKAISLKPDYAQAHNNLGDVLQKQGKLAEAVTSYHKAIRIKPDLAEVQYNLGDALKEQGKLEEAVASYQQAIRIKPDYAEAHNNLGVVLKHQGKLEEAVENCKKAIRIKPDFAEALNNLGTLLDGQNHLKDAVVCFQQAISIRQDFAEAYCNLGAVLKDQGKLENAVESLKQAIRLKPDYIDAYNSMGNAIQAQGRLEEAIACYQQVMSIRPDAAGAYSNLLFTMQYMSTVTPEDVFCEHRRYAERYEAPLKPYWQPHRNNRDPERRLKIGYVSGDFRNHAVAFFIEPILANHDKSQVEVYCYYNYIRHDNHTDRIAAYADHWLDCAWMKDEQLAERIRADGIDILIDLSGHTAYNRLTLFARKPSPAQVTWIGYAGTTGLTAMDYRITDAYMDSPGLTERFHTESLIRLPDTGAAYWPEPGCPPVNPLPALTSGELIFACLNNLIKINSAVTALWARLLMALPHARLMLGNVSDSGIQQRLIEMFGKEGIPSERLILQPRMPTADYLALHQKIDLALDPFPYNGGTSTMHSLWMGVPVITLAGEHSVSRVGVSALSRLGLGEFITHNKEEYLQCALQFAQDLPGLDRIRQSLRERMSGANCNPVTITCHLETAYRVIWRKWCAT